eukprot:4428467-Alexandrium_andersonii.AAC.1
MSTPASDTSGGGGGQGSAPVATAKALQSLKSIFQEMLAPPEPHITLSFAKCFVAEAEAALRKAAAQVGSRDSGH